MCKYCGKDDEYESIFLKNIKVLGQEIPLELTCWSEIILYGGDHCEIIEKTKINYCPMCGRKFEEGE